MSDLRSELEAREISFEGVMPVLQLPFGDELEQPILCDALARLAEWLIQLGADGLVVLGLASEAWALTELERDAVCVAVREAAADQGPLVVGIDGATTVAIDRARRATRLGAARVMVLPPPGTWRNKEIAAHFVRVADAAGVPILIQDAPQVTGVELSAGLLVELAEADPLLRSVKIESLGAGPKISAVTAHGLEVVAGWGGLHYLEAMRRGAVGCMPGSDLGPAFVEIHRLAMGGSLGSAEETYQKILPLLVYETQSLELLVLAAKRALVRLGLFPSGGMRPPARELDEEEARTLDALFEALERAGVRGWRE